MNRRVGGPQSGAGLLQKEKSLNPAAIQTPELRSRSHVELGMPNRTALKSGYFSINTVTLSQNIAMDHNSEQVNVAVTLRTCILVVSASYLSLNIGYPDKGFLVFLSPPK